MTAFRHAVSTHLATLPNSDLLNHCPAQITTKLLEQLRTNTPQSPPEGREPGPADQLCALIPTFTATFVSSL